MLSMALLALVTFIGAIAGFLIGAVGIGGIIILPLLIHIPVLSLSLHDTIPSLMLAYIVVACAGSFAYSRHSSINWMECQHVLYAATPAAFASSATLNMFPERMLELILYSLMSVTSVFSLRSLLSHSR